MSEVKGKKPTGRPTLCTPELTREICDTIATSSISLKKLCKEKDHWPHFSNLMVWVRDKPAFQDQYTKAKRNQVEVFIDELVSLSDDSSDDHIENNDGTITMNTVKVQRDRLRIDTRKWIACKLAPKIYGDRLQHDTANNDNDEIKVAITLAEKNRSI